MSKAQEHGTIEWIPVVWEAVYGNLKLVVAKRNDDTWNVGVIDTKEKKSIHSQLGYPDVMTAQRAAANWFIEWQKEQAQK